MLLLTLASLTIYSSILNNQLNTIKNINRIGIISLLYTIYINILTLEIESLTNGITLFNNLFIITPINMILIIIIIIIAILLLTPLMSNTLLNTNMLKKEYILLVFFNLLGLILVMLSNDLISLYISIELQSYGLYLITAIDNKSNKSSKASLFYFMIGGIASVLLLFSIAIIYTLVGITNLMDIQSLNNINIEFGLIILIIALLIKVGSGPFHSWSISIYSDTPLVITAWISIMAKLSILTFIISFISTIDQLTNQYIYIFINLFSLLSMIIGSINGLNQIKIRSLFAYSGILNIGYLLIAINSTSDIGYIIYITQYALIHVNFFLILWLLDSKEIQLIVQLKGLYYQNIYLWFTLIIIFFSLIGIPPLIGFYAKFYILVNSMSSGLILASIILILSSSISTYYYAYIIKTTWSLDFNPIYIISQPSIIVTYLISSITIITILASFYIETLIKVTSIMVQLIYV